jgi:hypothetical protein
MYRQEWIPGSFGSGVSLLPMNSTPAVQILQCAPIYHNSPQPYFTYPTYNPFSVVITPAPLQNYHNHAGIPFAVNTTQYVQNYVMHPRVLESSFDQIQLIPATSAASAPRSLSRSDQQSGPNAPHHHTSLQQQIVLPREQQSSNHQQQQPTSHKQQPLLSRDKQAPSHQQGPNQQSQPSESITQLEAAQPSEEITLLSPPTPVTPTRLNKKLERIRFELAFIPPSQDPKGTPPDGTVFLSRRKSGLSES